MDFDVANVTQSDIAYVQTAAQLTPAFLRISGREKTQRRGALRPVTVRQLFKTEIKEELTRRGQPGYCYYLDGNEFSLVGLTLVLDNFQKSLLYSCRPHSSDTSEMSKVPAMPTRPSVSRTGPERYHRRLRLSRIRGRMIHRNGGGYFISRPSKPRGTNPDNVPHSAGEYARVFGVPRDFNGVRLFQIRFIRPIEDPHEVFFHLMEAMTVTLEHSRGPPPVCASNFSWTALTALSPTETL